MTPRKSTAVHRIALVAAVLLATAACASSGKAKPRSTYDRNRLTREELATRAADNMHAVISAMRPNWLLTPMGASGIGATAATAPVTIIVDGQLYGGADFLKTVAASSVDRARYYGTTEAQSKFGFRVESPVIEIVTLKPGSS